DYKLPESDRKLIVDTATSTVDQSVNNGGSTNYYQFEPEWSECSDVIESRGMNYNQGNIFKSAFCFNLGRHSGTDAVRELNKIIYFAQRQLELEQS
ncbi:MAG: hypothetical protein U9O83_06365, partial [Campylobacterota bacterium]|nr:hypothetical protein [Campylobacterota bacterium]